MKDTLKKLREKKYIASILLVVLIVFMIELISILKPVINNIKIDKVLSKTSSLNASVIDGVSEGVISNNYDEIKYTIKVNKESSDTAVIIGTLTDKENKYARFKEIKNSVVSENGKKITVTTEKDKTNIIVTVENAPYGEIIKPSFTINSIEEDKSKIDVEPVVITGRSVEGKIYDEDGIYYKGLELSLTKNGEEIKNTYSKDGGEYVFSLKEEENYEVKLSEDKYKIVRYEEKTTDSNRRVLNLVIKEVEPFNINIKKTISKLDLVVNGNKQTYDYDDETKVVRSMKNARTIEGSIYYNISIKNEGEIKGTLTGIKDIVPEGLSFDESKNPGWTKNGKYLFYTVLEGEEIDAFGKTSATLILDIKKTNEARNYINKAIANGEDYKYIAYYLNNQVYREEYVVANEKIEDINPNVSNFAGWYTDKNYSNRYDFDKEVTKDLILFGKINNNKYNVTFIDVDPNNDQETILDIVEVNEGESVELIDHPEHRGYTFKCFELNNECYNEEPIYEDVTIYTTYKINTYDIIYNLDGGELETSKTNPDAYTVKDTFTLNNPSKEGYTFTGWTGTDLSDKTIDVTIPEGSIGDREYIATYEINKSTLTINPNGGSYENNASSVSFTENYGTIKTISDSVRTGYNFTGYTHTGGGSFNNNIYTFDNDNGVLTAEYEIITYRINYENITEDEKAFINNPVEYNVETDTFTLRNPNTRVDNQGNPSEDFLGWDDGNGNISLTVTIEKGSTGDRTYRAVWRENQNEYGITYELHGGVYESGKINPSTYTRATETFTLNNPGKTGYTFKGWSGTDLTGNTNTEVTIPKGSAGDRAYEANYDIITYSITYDYDGGVLPAGVTNPTEYTVESNTINIANPSKEGYIFEGWSGTDIDDKSTSVTIPHGSTGDRVYTANFKKIEYSLTYTLNGGEYETGKTNPDKYTIESPDITLNNPHKDGYTFKGWSGTDLTGDANALVVIPHGSMGHRSYLANYTPITYNITYDYAEGNLPTGVTNPSTYTIETDDIVFNTPEKEGYTFLNYTIENVITTGIPKGSMGDKHAVAHYEINHYTVRYHNENEIFASETVDWGNYATRPLSDPTKAHNIFLYWTENQISEFDFANTQIKENKDLYAVYEEVKAPVITVNPTLDDVTNRTWVCGDEANDACGVTVTITNNPELVDTTGYEIYYKVGDGAATLYTGPFKVYANEQVTAFAKKSNIYSANTTEDIVNVDLIAPTINQPSTGSMSFNMTVSGVAQDAGSGVKKFTLYAKEKDALVYDDTLTYESETFDGISDHAENYYHTFYNVHDNTEYTVKVVAEDYVGNISELEVDVTTHPYVARVVGKNGILWYTVDPDTKEFVIEDGKEFLLFDSIQAAVDYCAEIQCTIQTNPIMPVVNESVTIAENQNITIDLDGRGVVSDSSATFVNNGELHIVDRNPRMNGTEHESIGFVRNTTSKAIVNNNNFILGEGSSEPSETFVYPELDRPIIEGKTNAIEQNNKFHFYDGKLVSEDTVMIDHGDDAITQYSYNVIFTGEDDKKIGTLEIVTDPEARIRSTYYAKLKNNGLNAFDSSQSGTVTTEETKLLSRIKQAGDYGFIYDAVNDEIYSGNDSTANTTALSYIKLDLTNETEGKYITFDTFIDSYNSNSYGYISVSEVLGQTGTQIYSGTGNDSTATRIYYLEKGKTYYVYFGFVKGGGDVNPNETFRVTSFKMLGERETTSDFTIYGDPSYYGFSKQEDGSFLSNNKGINNTTAHAYSIFDLRNETEDINLMINVTNTINHGYDRAWIYTSNNINYQGYDTTTNRYYALSSADSNRTIVIPLKAGEVTYVHYGYYNYYDANGGFSINNITFSKSKSENIISPGEISHNSGDTYYFNDTDYDLWEDLSDNHKEAIVLGSTLNEEENGYVFDGNDYAIVIGGVTNTALTSESVEVEFSTNNTSNQVYYIGSSNQNIGIGTYDSYIIVSNKNNAITYNIPDNLADGEKHKITVTFNEGTYSAYFDNEPMVERSNTNCWSGTSSNIYIGKRENYDNYFTGTIYGLKVFNRALSSDEISNPSDEGLLLNFDGANSSKTHGHGFINTNIAGYYNTAHGYVTYDLTDVNEDKYLYVSAAMSRLNGSGYVSVSDSATVSSGGRGLDLSSTVNNASGILKLTKNKVNYVHFVYSNDWNSNPRLRDFFLIKELRYCNTLEDAYSVNPNSFSKENNYYFEKPVLNEKVDTIELLKNITLTSALVVPQEKEVVLDLNGFTLTSQADDYIIKNNGKLTITDSEYEDRQKQNVNYKIEQARLFEEAKSRYLADKAEYEEYAGLCDGCEPSDEYKLDHINHDFNYIGSEEEFTVHYAGTYKLQVWGAQGGYRSSSSNGGKGGYSEGIIEFGNNETIYAYVGGSGNTGGTAGGFNGGGSKTTYAGGGGATDIRVEGNTLYHRIIVAGGGGSDGAAGYSGKAGGGLSGVTATETSYCSGGEGGTQTTAGTRGSFGQGGSGGFNNNGWGGGGFGGAGGGGWYGGGGVNPDRSDDDRGGGGGSGFVYTDASIEPVEGYLVNNHILTDASTIAGTESIPTYDGSSTMIGNSGNGFAKITLVHSDEADEARANLSKTYNIKEEPHLVDYLDGIDFINSIDINTLTPADDAEYNNVVFDAPIGSITTTINNAILNEEYATLIYERGALNLNVNSKIGIVNRGNLNIGEFAEINANNSSTIGVYNETNGNVVGLGGVINAKGSSSIGLLNRSYTPTINGIKVVSTQSNATDISNNAIADVTYINLDATGVGTGFSDCPTANVNIVNSNIKSTGNNAYYECNSSLPIRVNISSSNLYGTLSTDYSASIINVDNSTLTSIYNYLGYVRINNSSLTSINNNGKTIVNSSTLSNSGTIITNNSTRLSGRTGTQHNSSLILRDSIINSTATSATTVINNTNDMIISNAKINNINNVSSTAISNSPGSDNGAYLSVVGNTIIDSSFGTAINNTGTLTIGSSGNNTLQEYEYGYTGHQEEFVAPEDGYYKLETWGASSGRIRSSSYDGFWIRGGFGGYASGVVYLHAGDKLYIHVGQAGVYGNQNYGSYNGGGYSRAHVANSFGNASSGGGATDISLSSEDNHWTYDNGISMSIRSNDSYEQRILVAGGGGVCAHNIYYSGYDINYSTCSGGYATSSTQLGYGANSGGGGYYGGTTASGGSSYVSDTLTNAVMKTGNEEMPDYTSSGLVKGNMGNGFAKISLLSSDNQENIQLTPTISAVNYGITGSGKVIYYDGTITANTSVNSDISDVPKGYDIYNSKDENNKEKMILVANSNSRPVEQGEEEFVAAIGSAKYTTIQNALDASNNGDEIDLLVDIQQQNMITIPDTKTITIDYNGHTIKSYNNNYLYKNLGNLTITDSQNELKKNTFMGDKYIYNEGTLKVSNLYIADYNYTACLIDNNEGTVTLDSVKLDFGTLVSSKSGIYNTENGTINVKNSTLNLYNANNMLDNYGTLILKDNTILGSSSATIVINRETGTATLDGNSYSVSGNDNNGRYFLYNESGTATVKNMTTHVEDLVNTGILTLEDNNIPSGALSNSGLVIINSGSYSNSFSNSGTGKSIDDTDNLYTFIMHDGTINKTLNRSATGIFNIEKGTITVTSGVAINNTSTGTINLGIHDGSALSKENTEPVITGKTYGIYTSTPTLVVNFYDGIVTGQSSYNVTIEDIETGYSIYREYDDVNSIETKYLTDEPMFTNVTQNVEYDSVDDFNDAITNNLVNNNDVIKAYRNITISKNDASITIPAGLNITFDLNGKVIDKNNELMFTNNGELTIIDSESTGLVDSTHGNIFNNNGTLNIGGGKYISEKDTTEVEVILNNENATLNISGGTFTKYYDSLGYRQRNSGAIIVNDGTANVTGGKFYANGSYVLFYYRRIGGNGNIGTGGTGDSNYFYTSAVFVNNSTGTLTVTGGEYDGITSASYEDNYGWQSYSTTNKGELIYNYGIASFTGITSDNSHIGRNDGTMTMDNVTMESIVNINHQRYTWNSNRGSQQNLINTGDLTIEDSSFKLYSTLVDNRGNLDITNTTIDRLGNGTAFSNEGDSSWLGPQSSYVIRNIYNSNQDNHTNITDSYIYNKGSGEAIYNRGLVNVVDTTIETSSSSSIISSNGIVNVKGQTSITSGGESGVYITSSATLNLGEPIEVDNAVSKTYPILKGKQYGVTNSSSTFNFYDGIIGGKTNRVNGVINNIEAGYGIIEDTEDDYLTNYLDRIPIVQNITQATSSDEKKYYDLNAAFADANDGDILQMIANYSNLPTTETAVNDSNITFDLNGMYIRQCNNLLITNNAILNLTDSSEDKTGQIIGISGSKVIDNFGTINFTGGKITSSALRLIIKNNASSLLNIKEEGKIDVSNISTLVDNDGTLNITNGAYLHNHTGDPNSFRGTNDGLPMIINRNELNIKDLNNDDDDITSSTYAAPRLHSEGIGLSDFAYWFELGYYDSIIRNETNATATIYGGTFNNGSTTSPDYGRILHNFGTVVMKNMNSYAYVIGYNNGSLTIENSTFNNFCTGGLVSIAGTLTIKNTSINFYQHESTSGFIGNNDAMYIGNATLDHVTMTGGQHIDGEDPLRLIDIVGPSEITDSSINLIAKTRVLYNSSTLRITNTPINIDKAFENAGTLTLDNSDINVSNSTGISNSGTVNFVNSDLTVVNGTAISNSGRINFNTPTTVSTTKGNGIYNTGQVTILNGVSVTTQDGNGIYLEGNGKLIVGEMGGVPDQTDPRIEGSTYGVYNNSRTSEFEFYDGVLIGGQGPNAIYGGLTYVESGYETENILDPNDNKYHEYLVLSASTVAVATVGTYTFSANSFVTPSRALQQAINHAIGDGQNVQVVNLVTNVDLVNDGFSLTASMPVTVNLNGHTIVTDSTNTVDSNINLNGSNLGGNLSKLLGDVFDINNNPKNILIYEMSDGSKLDTSKIYTLYRDGKVLGLEKEELGKYRYKGNDENLTSIRGRLYLNNLNKGSYRLVSNDNKSIEFSIDEDGNISGNVTENPRNSSQTVAQAESEAELILTIQTGKERHYYWLLFIPILFIIGLLLIKSKKREMN